MVLRRMDSRVLQIFGRNYVKKYSIINLFLHEVNAIDQKSPNKDFTARDNSIFYYEEQQLPEQDNTEPYPSAFRMRKLRVGIWEVAGPHNNSNLDKKRMRNILTLHYGEHLYRFEIRRKT